MKKNKTIYQRMVRTFLRILSLTAMFSIAFQRECLARENPSITQMAVYAAPRIDALRVGATVNSKQVDAQHLDQYFTMASIQKGDKIYRRIADKSFPQNDQIALEDLRYLKLLHYNFKHEIQVGELIVNKNIAADVLEIFKKLYEKEYEIASIKLIDDYWPQKSGRPGPASEISGQSVDQNAGVLADVVSMKLNNTSCFNYRVVPDTKSLSKHALGYAIDINPLQNPYVIFDKDGEQKLQAEGDASYIDRSNRRTHMIDHEDLAYQLFTEYGFQWGGDWVNSKDYQHFVKAVAIP